MSSISPRRNLPPSPLVPPPQTNPDESWETPGQEGEVSLIASSTCTADLSRNDSFTSANNSIDELTVPWSGVPVIHSSPLSLPNEGNTSRDPETSLIELPSRDWNFPGDQDHSNLLTQKFFYAEGAPSFDTSIAISEVEALPRPELPRIESTASEQLFTLDTSMGSDRSASFEMGNDSNPTIRRTLPPFVPLPISDIEPHTPPKDAPRKGCGSIFADMSAEQADMSWPLLRAPLGASPEEERDETIFHSTIISQQDISRSSPNPPRIYLTPSSKSQHSPEKAGNSTQFFDCTATSPSFLSLSLLDHSPQSTPTVRDFTSLIRPTQAVFEAHNAQTKALQDQVDLYKHLAERLQAEVVERDEALVELNLRVLEDQAVHAAGDRTTVVQAETKDLEIRLAKALSDQEGMIRRQAEDEARGLRLKKELDSLREKVKVDEEKERDDLLKQRNLESGLASQVEAGKSREEAMRLEMEEIYAKFEGLEAELEEATGFKQEVERLEKENAELREVKMADEEEMTRLGGAIEKARRKEVDLRNSATRLEREVESGRLRWAEAQEDLLNERGTRESLEHDKREVCVLHP
jgi:hypothetical protein